MASEASNHVFYTFKSTGENEENPVISMSQ